MKFTPRTKFIDLYTARDLPPERVEVAPFTDPRLNKVLWVTRDGRICNFINNYRQGWKCGKYVVRKGRIINGYLCFNIFERREFINVSLHTNRVVCSAWHGPCPHPGWHADHINGNRLDNRAENLQWLSQQENNAKRVKKYNLHEYNISVHERGYAQPILTTSSLKAVDRFIGNTMASSAIVPHSPGHFIIETRKYEIVVHKQLKHKAHD